MKRSASRWRKPGEAVPPDERCLRAYWRWWLKEAVPLAGEWVLDPEGKPPATGS